MYNFNRKQSGLVEKNHIRIYVENEKKQNSLFFLFFNLKLKLNCVWPSVQSVARVEHAGLEKGILFNYG